MNTDRRTIADDLLAPLYASVRRAAFWTAVLVPFALLLLWLLGAGLSGWRLSAFGGLLALELLALVVGHGHAACSEA